MKEAQNNQSRDAPEKRSAVWLCSADAFEVLVGSGYTKLANCPEVRMCVDIYADLIIEHDHIPDAEYRPGRCEG